MPTGIASSVEAENDFDLLTTVYDAVENNISIVQLYIDINSHPEWKDEEYMETLVGTIKDYGLGVVFHLPDLNKITEEDLRYTEKIQTKIEDDCWSWSLVHYVEGMTINQIPSVNGKKVGIENSKSGIFDKEHVQSAMKLAREAQVPFVFDFGRILYTADDNESAQNEVIGFITILISRLKDSDIIHAVDKTSWSKRFRECWTYLGDPNGKGYSLIPTLKAFSAKGGLIILEHENFDLALKSFHTLES